MLFGACLGAYAHAYTYHMHIIAHTHTHACLIAASVVSATSVFSLPPVTLSLAPNLHTNFSANTVLAFLVSPCPVMCIAPKIKFHRSANRVLAFLAPPSPAIRGAALSILAVFLEEDFAVLKSQSISERCLCVCVCVCVYECVFLCMCVKQLSLRSSFCVRQLPLQEWFQNAKRIPKQFMYGLAMVSSVETNISSLCFVACVPKTQLAIQREQGKIQMSTALFPKNKLSLCRANQSLLAHRLSIPL